MQQGEELKGAREQVQGRGLNRGSKGEECKGKGWRIKQNQGKAEDHNRVIRAPQRGTIERRVTAMQVITTRKVGGESTISQAEEDNREGKRKHN